MPKIPATRRQAGISDDDVLASLQAVLKSNAFSHSTTLRQALEFVVKNSLASPGEPIKEYSVATEAFGRGSDFDPKIDNIVRVQMHRLREKLNDFYLGDGHDEQILITIPRGQYSPTYVRNSPDTQPSIADPPHVLEPADGLTGRRVNFLWIAIVALVISNVLFAVKFLRNRSVPQPATLSRSLRPLWQPFFSPGNRPLIVFANPAFLVDKRGDMYRYNSPYVLSMAMGTRVPIPSNQDAILDGRTEDGPFYYFDSYTGAGELVAASAIARFLTLHGENYVIERSRLTSNEEIMRNDVIFLGGDKEDRILRKLPLHMELTFEPPPPNEYPVGSYIKNINPSPGQPSTYHLQLDPETGAIQVEYALISLLPNVSINHDVLDLGGLTTLGTQAAAKFVTSSHDMAVLEAMRISSSTAKTPSRFFQALLEIRVRNGVPLDAKCLLVRDLR